MRIRTLHSWDMDYPAARAVQEELAARVLLTPVAVEPKVVAGMDCAPTRDKKRMCAAVVVLRLPDMEVIETGEAVEAASFPYVPGLLSFREAPTCLAVLAGLRVRPDLLIIDGQGRAHPRRFGLASHIGLLADVPTIGCAKSRLIGEFEPVGLDRGSRSPLTDGEETIGAVVRTRANIRPVFVSIGHRCTLDDAVRLVLACATRYRLPEPTRLAHQWVTRLRMRA